MIIISKNITADMVPAENIVSFVPPYECQYYM